MKTEIIAKTINDSIGVGDYFAFNDTESAIYRLVLDTSNQKVRILGVTSGKLFDDFDSIEDFANVYDKKYIVKVVPKHYDTTRCVMVFTEV
jgi:hypothetical protein